MTERQQQRLVNHRLAVLRHAEEVTGIDMSCSYLDGFDSIYSGSRRVPRGGPTLQFSKPSDAFDCQLPAPFHVEVCDLT